MSAKKCHFAPNWHKCNFTPCVIQVFNNYRTRALERVTPLILLSIEPNKDLKTRSSQVCRFGTFMSSWTSNVKVQLYPPPHFQQTLYRLEETWKCIICHLVESCAVHEHQICTQLVYQCNLKPVSKSSICCWNCNLTSSVIEAGTCIKVSGLNFCETFSDGHVLSKSTSVPSNWLRIDLRCSSVVSDSSNTETDTSNWKLFKRI